jgi:acyl-CoA hydrolase
MATMTPVPAKNSRVEMTQLVMPSHANGHGTAFGGTWPPAWPPCATPGCRW